MPAKRGSGRRVVLNAILDEVLGPGHGFKTWYDRVGPVYVGPREWHVQWVLDFAAWRPVAKRKFRVRNRAPYLRGIDSLGRRGTNSYGWSMHRDHDTLEDACYDLAGRIKDSLQEPV